jgi:hypothetical protein
METKPNEIVAVPNECRGIEASSLILKPTGIEHTNPPQNLQ